MNIKVAAFTVSEKSINTRLLLAYGKYHMIALCYFSYESSIGKDLFAISVMSLVLVRIQRKRK